MPPKKVTDNEEYEEKDLRTHIYENSDTYAGSDQMIKSQSFPAWVMKKQLYLSRRLEYIPVTYKCFDEIIVNARDHQRERLKDREGAVNLTEIKSTLINRSGISVYNNGDSIKD